VTDENQLTVVDSVFGGHSLTIYHCDSCQMVRMGLIAF